LGDSGVQRRSHQQGGRGGFVQRASVAPAGLDTPAPVKLGWQAAIANTVAGLGYELVDVERAQRGLLRVYIDRIPGRQYFARHGAVEPDAVAGLVAQTEQVSEFVTVEDCETVTRQLQYVLEVEGLDYARLEVSSPGLDRPLKREADFQRFAGQLVSVTLKQPFQNRKSWQGLLTSSGEGLGLVFKEGKAEQVLNFSFDEVREARLVPAVDFKGRKAKPAGTAGSATGEPGSGGSGAGNNAVAPVDKDGGGGLATPQPMDDGDRNR
jgi:ribosome maturation factor RimP